ncbi:adenosylcobinamide amidohydrolase [Halorubrum aethiopicum]|uniref:adenosylcobinamide amidohydrolase n=1 Tax=Halorubrum aethiopicum TaxID=1758255 RepID=UPI0008300522|nr:adenosylcobinamide amidohydrolase [Halorubrum aethiopicum]
MSPRSPVFRADVADGVCRFWRTDGPTRFLSTGFDGGVRVADAAHNVTVPEGWDDAGRRDLREYVDRRVRDAGFEAGGDGASGDRSAAPALLTGVDQRHARLARLDGATVVATAGVSNPAALSVTSVDGDAVDDGPARVDAGTDGDTTGRGDVDGDDAGGEGDDAPPAGTVNLLVGTERALESGALANLVAVAAEAKAATLLATVGFPGTTSDAVVVGCPTDTGPGGPEADDREPAAFSGAATPVGSAVRACVRDAVRASLVSRYGPELEEAPASVADAEYGVVTDRPARVSTPDATDPASGETPAADR